jgi:ABC-type lipoprotein release transport system permease subunit
VLLFQDWHNALVAGIAFGAGILLVVCFVIVVKYLFNGLKEFLKI